jgi:hypothetical protein
VGLAASSPHSAGMRSSQRAHQVSLATRPDSPPFARRARLVIGRIRDAAAGAAWIRRLLAIRWHEIRLEINVSLSMSSEGFGIVLAMRETNDAALELDRS